MSEMVNTRHNFFWDRTEAGVFPVWNLMDFKCFNILKNITKNGWPRTAWVTCGQPSIALAGDHRRKQKHGENVAADSFESVGTVRSRIENLTRVQPSVHT
jgi:hypothetical protein